MRDTTRAEKLLSLFASPDSATAIAGDLTEERQHRGSIWFWIHLSTTIVALWRNAVISAPLANLRLAAAGCVLFATTAFGGTAAVSLFPQIVGSPLYWIALSVFWWGAAFWTGVSLVSLSPKRGMVACAMLAVTGEVLLLAFGVTALWLELSSTEFVIIYTAALVVALPLLAGGSVARRRMITCGPPVLCLLLTVATPASAQYIEWKDPSPHVAKMVTVDDQVQLEVLDWGGSGREIVLLAGLGDTAHVFDDAAPMMAMRYRVVGVTRRGHPRSSAPATGYTSTQLADDVVRVMAAIGLQRPIVVGHSFAGEEMHVLGARYPTRIAGLVYVDAAFDRADRFEEHETATRALPTPPRPEPADLASFVALRAFLTRTQGPPGPEARLRARYVANADGSVRGAWTPDPQVMQAFSSEMRAMSAAYHPERIRVPALAIYAAPKSADELMRPWYNANDPTVRERVEKLYPLERENVSRHARWFAAFAERGRISELSGGHDLFVSNPREVLQQIDGFVSSIAATR